MCDDPHRPPTGAQPTSTAKSALSALLPKPLTAGAERAVRIVANVTGAAFAVLFGQASLNFYLHTHSLVGGLFVIEQAWFVIAFLTRRPPREVGHRLPNWLAATGGTFGGLLLRPNAAHVPWSVKAGFILQLAGLVIVIMSLLALGRSIGFLAADRGVKTKGPYAVIRHPVYASYLLIGSGYVLQSVSVRNIAIFAFVTACNVFRALAEERVLAESETYRAYQQRVRWRLVPYLW